MSMREGGVLLLRECLGSHRVGWSASVIAIEVVGLGRAFGRRSVGPVRVGEGDGCGIGDYSLEIGSGISRDVGAASVSTKVCGWVRGGGGRGECVVVKLVIIMLVVWVAVVLVLVVVVVRTGIMLLVMERSRAGRHWCGCGAQAVLLVAPVHSVVWQSSVRLQRRDHPKAVGLASIRRDASQSKRVEATTCEGHAPRAVVSDRR